ncbi:NAD(P)H-dependent oxidoreductase [Evansella sp. AB-P1]|uniref:NADPH-dependent FMN reductase n=1 Tax=Evansella sp. AB-P1 TaxID=3037653 RepID=UPI00241EC2E8|nr:NAD(P)H-dependent oxidoreductase [Evansella sp. AB-P1]MDG5787980.1 NAD(P)H-dependent oxidoreductase [Evansella sp. AB-P1]
MNKEKTVIFINGSMNKKSFTKKLLKNVEERMKKNGTKTIFVDIRELELPVYDPDLELPEILKNISTQLIEADGLVVGVPEYHGSYTGAIKNFLDYFGFQEFEKTPIALLTTTGGLKAGTNTLNHLRLVFRNLHGIVIPQQFAICKKETTNNLDLDDATDLRLEKLVQGLETEVQKKVLFEAFEKQQLQISYE